MMTLVCSPCSQGVCLGLPDIGHNQDLPFSIVCFQFNRLLEDLGFPSAYIFYRFYVMRVEIAEVPCRVFQCHILKQRALINKTCLINAFTNFGLKMIIATHGPMASLRSPATFYAYH